MNIFLFSGLIICFLACQYMIEKRPFKLVILEKLDFFSFPKALIYCLAILLLQTVITVIFPILLCLNVAFTLFIASYLVYRYRKLLERRMKE